MNDLTAQQRRNLLTLFNLAADIAADEDDDEDLASAYGFQRVRLTEWREPRVNVPLRQRMLVKR